MDDLEVFEKRTEILSGAKLRETDRISTAVKMQDTIRSKAGKWNGSIKKKVRRSHITIVMRLAWHPRAE